MNLGMDAFMYTLENLLERTMFSKLDQIKESDWFIFCSAKNVSSFNIEIWCNYILIT